MTELPALREALRDTAERQIRRRSRRRMRGIVAPLAIVACALTLVLTLPHSGPPAPTEEATRTPTPSATPRVTAEQVRLELAKRYSVFGRPARASDRVPANFRGGGAPGRQVDWSQTRRIASAGGVSAYAYPEFERGIAQLCTLLQASAQIGGGGCPPLAANLVCV
jgi:hypothetical protein